MFSLVFIIILTIVIIVFSGLLLEDPVQAAGRMETWRMPAAPNRTQRARHPELTNLGTCRHLGVDIGEQMRGRHRRTEPEVGS